MKTVKLFANGQELDIDKRIGKGGEGEVFAVSNMPGFALKAYLPDLVAGREKKIRAMVGTRLAELAPMVAFPHQVVVNDRGAFVGFMMRLVEKHKEIHELQTPSSRQKYFPKADYGFIVRVAVNIARVFAQVHATGCVIGDINQRGILVSPSATVALIDADSFQVSDGSQQYLCVVGVPEYTPPELQGKSLKSVVRTIDHDAFGLAVCLFQLLCMDRHPFSGRYSGHGDMPLEKAIAEYRFAYSSRNTGMTPPLGTVRLDDFTPRVAQLFDQAFAPNYVGKRPSVSMWVEAMAELEGSLRACSHSKLHRYARTAKECPWCRMEAEYGRALFIDTEISRIHVPNGRLDPTVGFVLDIAALMAAINGVFIPDTLSVVLPQTPVMPEPSQAAQTILLEKRRTPASRIAGIVILLGAIYAFASDIPGFVALAIAVLGIWLLIRSSSSADGLISEYKQHVNAVSSRVEQLQRFAPIEPVLRKKAEVLDAIDEFKQLAAAFGNIKSEYDKHRKQKQLDDHLSQFSIRGARIPKVNSSNIAELASYGFTTALDVKRRNVQQVHGIGPIKAANIAAWVSGVESKFHFRSAYTVEDQMGVQKAQNEIVMKQQGLEERIKKAIGEFRYEAQEFERWKTARDPDLVRLCQQLTQAEVDLQHLNIPLPSKLNVKPRVVPAVSTFRRGAQTTNVGVKFGSAAKTISTPPRSHAVTCPQCGSNMIRRTARRGARSGKAFWGCSRYPACTGTRPI